MRLALMPASGLLAAVLSQLAGRLAPDATLDTVKARGDLQCGVNTGLAGFSAPDDKGNWTGLDVDLLPRGCGCDLQGRHQDQVRAADGQGALHRAAVRRDRRPVAQHDLDDEPRHVSRGSASPASTTYDGQGFMVKKSLDVVSAKELSGASICVQTGTTTELNLADYFRSNKIEYNPVVFEKLPESDCRLQRGAVRCLHDRRLAALCHPADAG